MDPIVLAAGTALVGAMATDAWQQARSGMVTWWRRTRPEQADSVDADLVLTRERLVDARRADDSETEQALVAAWQSRFQQLLQSHPSVAVDLARFTADHFARISENRAQTPSPTMHATASGNGRVYQAGRDQHNTGA
ncbi:hypothetical protein [Streptomyces coeruleorubidus]|uniref:hypothetical protein n=1 Tax=Streptomyces coeruleorubidus TaxID=116188 RepID=UPI00379D7CF5